MSMGARLGQIRAFSCCRGVLIGRVGQRDGARPWGMSVAGSRISIDEIPLDENGLLDAVRPVRARIADAFWIAGWRCWLVFWRRCTTAGTRRGSRPREVLRYE